MFSPLRRNVLRGILAIVAVSVIDGLAPAAEPFLRSITAVPGQPAVPQPEQAQVKAATSNERFQPRLMNITGEPFKFRFARRSCGPTWTKEFTLGPGETLMLDAKSIEGGNEIEELHLFPGRAIVRYPDYCGYITARIDLQPDAVDEVTQNESLEAYFGGRVPEDAPGRLPILFVIRDHDGHIQFLRPNVQWDPNWYLTSPEDLVQWIIKAARLGQEDLQHPERAPADRHWAPNAPVFLREPLTIAQFTGQRDLYPERHITALKKNHLLTCPNDNSSAYRMPSWPGLWCR